MKSFSGWGAFVYNYPTVKIAFLFHLYQPPTQNETTFRKVVEESYQPLIKLIKNRKDFRLTLNMPLSILEQFDKYGYDNWISQVKELVDMERVELIGSAAYHPLLTKMSPDTVEKQVILDEYGLGYYFGRRTGFEGEKAVMVRDLRGFFPPELAVSSDLLGVIGGLDYEWVLVDETAIPLNNGHDRSGGRYGVYTLPDLQIKIVSRNRDLSNCLAFSRESSLDNFIEGLYLDGNSSLVALDGEFFGHHYKEGIFMLDSLLDELRQREIGVVTASEYVDSIEDSVELESVVESSWGASDQDINSGNPYPLWYNPENEIQEIQWELADSVHEHFNSELPASVSEDATNIPFWKDSVLDSLKEELNHDIIRKDLLFHKALHSDQFWWASGMESFQNVLFNPGMIRASLDIYKRAAGMTKDDKYIKFVDDKSSEISQLIDKKE